MARRKGFFSENQRQEIARTIAGVQQKTTGRMRVYVDTRAGSDLMARVEQIFVGLGLGTLPSRNGVLLYMAVKDGRLAVLGDTGINEKAPEDYWDRVRDGVQERFRYGDFVGGVVYFVEEVGGTLAKHFPRKISRKSPADRTERVLPAEKPGLKRPEKYRKLRRSFAGPRKAVPVTARREFEVRRRRAEQVLYYGAFGFILPFVGSIISVREFLDYFGRYAGRSSTTYRVPGRGISISQPPGIPSPDRKAWAGVALAVLSAVVWVILLVGYASHRAQVRADSREWEERWGGRHREVEEEEYELPRYRRRY